MGHNLSMGFKLRLYGICNFGKIDENQIFNRAKRAKYHILNFGKIDENQISMQAKQATLKQGGSRKNHSQNIRKIDENQISFVKIKFKKQEKSDF